MRSKNIFIRYVKNYVNKIISNDDINRYIFSVFIALVQELNYYTIYFSYFLVDPYYLYIILIWQINFYYFHLSLNFANIAILYLIHKII